MQGATRYYRLQAMARNEWRVESFSRIIAAIVRAEMHSSSPVTWEDEKGLKEQLGEDGYRSFLREYLRACGERPEEVETIIGKMESWEKKKGW